MSVATPNGVKCSARTSAGNPCQKWAIRGGTVCVKHGGAAPQVKRRASLRLIELVDPAIATLARVMASSTAKDSDRIRAAENILDRAGVPRKVDVSDTDLARALLIDRLLAMRDSAPIDAEVVEEVAGVLDPSNPLPDNTDPGA